MTRMTRVSLSALAGAGLGLALVSTAAAEPPREIMQQQRAEAGAASQVAEMTTSPSRAGRTSIAHANNALSLAEIRGWLQRSGDEPAQLTTRSDRARTVGHPGG